MWWAEPSSSFVEYHEFLFVLLHPFLSFKLKAECHVKERTRRYFRRMFGDGEAETFEFGVAQPLEYEEEFSARFERFQQPGECQSETRRCFKQRLNSCETRTKIQPCILQQGNRNTLQMQVLGNRKKTSDSSDSINGEVWRHTWIGQRWIFVSCKSQIINTRERFSKICKRICQLLIIHQNLELNQLRPMYCCGDCSCHRQRKQPFILDRITLKIWKCARKRISRKSRVSSASLTS